MATPHYMRWIALFLLLSVSACGGNTDAMSNNCHGYGCAFDAVDQETGIRVRYDVASHYTLADVSFLYKSVLQCMGAPTDNGPLVIFVNHIGYNERGVPYGGYYFVDGLVLVADQNDYIIDHEFIHHALSVTGASDETNWGHQSQEFTGVCSSITLAIPVGQKPGRGA